MEFLQQGDAIRAFPYLARAIELEPKQSYVWNNLGSLYERAGNLHAARLAFEVALSERRGDLVAMSNASRVYQALGDTARADDLARRVATFRLSNPYFRYLQAMDAFRQQDYQKARDEVAAAIRLYRPEHRFHFLLGAIYERLGLHEQARASMREALTLTRDEKQIARYRDKMERLFAMQM
jgi:Flp pilus assembly protein TadD